MNSLPLTSSIIKRSLSVNKMITNYLPFEIVFLIRVHIRRTACRLPVRKEKTDKSLEDHQLSFGSLIRLEPQVKGTECECRTRAN